MTTTQPGEPLPVPREPPAEPQFPPRREDVPPRPTNLYGVTKLLGEEMVRRYVDLYGLS